jgi:hypothetical protein
MKKRHSSHQTQWAAQFAVASELCKRDYQVALTLGNHPAVDLMVRSPKGVQFTIDVKGLYRRNPWAVKEKELMDRLFYVFAFVPFIDPSIPDGATGPEVETENRFHIATQKEVNAALKAKYEVDRKRTIAKGKTMPREDKVSFSCLLFKLEQQWKDRWSVLPP